ncbi:MAG: hypothetical protein H6933_17610 [Burkholderiaceae bacterium]|nr:hypothetical protein [Rhodoferax sp.]MCP5286707.1 hypothetical protein [Burkholderiaceae bacterium]
MARWHRLGLSMLALACAAGGVRAQQVSAPPSAAIACMTPAAAERGAPAYPPLALERKDGATVRVELAFSAPDTEPALRLLDEAYVDKAFVEAVREHVQRLRVPCMPAGGEPVRLIQTYVFRPDDGRNVVSLPPRDTAQAEQARQRACLTRITPDKLPDYPNTALRNQQEGNYLVRLHFDAPTTPPRTEIVAGPRHSSLRASLNDFMPGYRLPCLTGAPVSVDLLFKFRIEEGARTMLKDLNLRQFVGAARTVPPGRFDFGTMGCPFDLRVSHFQPWKPHVVEQLGEARADRLDFIEWLSRVELKVDEKTVLALLGDTFTLSVPCGTLNL